MNHAIHAHESCMHVAVRVLHSSAFIVTEDHMHGDEQDLKLLANNDHDIIVAVSASWIM